MQESIALTWTTMTNRMRNFRFGALFSVALIAILIVSALVFRSGWVLAGLPALILVGVGFLQREHGLLFAWEDRVLALWGNSDLCVGILTRTLADYPHALKDSLKTMVATLPENPDFLVPAADRIKAYRWLFWTRSLSQEIRFARAAAFNFILSCLPVSIWYVSGAGWPWILLGISPICALPMAETVLTRLALRRWEARVKSLGDWSASALPDFRTRLDAIDWSRVPRKIKPMIEIA